MNFNSHEYKNMSNDSSKCRRLHINIDFSQLYMERYRSDFRELLHYLQGLLENFTDIAFACGSGGSAAGIGIANYLTGGKLK